MKINKEVKVGAFSIAGVALLLVGLSYLRGKSVFERSKHYKVVYHNVDGLLENSKVFLSGYPVGIVTSVEMDPETGKIHVEFEVNKKLAIPRDTKAMIVTLDLLGNRAIKLLLGRDSVLAEDGAILKDSLELGMLQNVYMQLLPLKEKIGFILDEIHHITQEVRLGLQDSNSRVSRITQNVENTTRNLSVISKNFVPLTYKLTSLSDTILSLASDIKKTTPKLNTIVENTQSITQSFKETATQLPPLVTETQTTMQNLRVVLNKIGNGEGSVGKLFNDPSLYISLVLASKSLDSLLIDLRNRPKRYVHFSVFGRKEKK
ncbi:MAG: MlaD family protein [Bacteroidia bacterium]|nr:MlaD family protein [Bacteroidia bacterium]MDW8157788.1 MlaD family protein [Bacteroidia bacterium]